MACGDVHTQRRVVDWENVVEGRPDLNRSFARRADAVSHGDDIATALGSNHEIDGDGSSTTVPDHLDGG